LTDLAKAKVVRLSVGGADRLPLCGTSPKATDRASRTRPAPPASPVPATFTALCAHLAQNPFAPKVYRGCTEGIRPISAILMIFRRKSRLATLPARRRLQLDMSNQATRETVWGMRIGVLPGMLGQVVLSGALIGLSLAMLMTLTGRLMSASWMDGSLLGGREGLAATGLAFTGSCLFRLRF